MTIGVPKEIKTGEHRVAAIPELIQKLMQRGHVVYVEQGAGIDSGFTDSDFMTAGAQITNQHTVWQQQCILKVKEPILSEYVFLKKDQILFSYLHLAGSSKSLTEQLLQKQVSAIAMETVEKNDLLNLAAPMSEVAGRMAIAVGGWYLQFHLQGKGVLLDRVQGLPPAQVVIIGAGTAGRAAVDSVLQRGATVSVFETSEDRRSVLRTQFENRDQLHIHPLDMQLLSHALQKADLVVGAALLPGARTPSIVNEATVAQMEKGSVIVDISIDQGGCFATSEVGTHANPIRIKHDILHYAVPNMPGAFPKTATRALVNATTPYILELADHGLAALQQDSGFNKGLMTSSGKLYSRAVAEYFSL